MSKLIIKDIKSKLQSMYIDYRFDIKCTPDGYNYMISVFKDHKNLGTFNTTADTPTNIFWDEIKAWMRSIFTKK